MKKIIILLSIIPLGIILVGCNPCKRLAIKCPQQDSVSYVETVKLDTITLYSPADTFIMRVPYDPVTLSDLGLEARHAGAEVKVKVVDRFIEVRAICPEDSLKAVISELESRTHETVRVPYPVTEYKVRKIHKFALWFSGLVLVSVVLYLVNRYKKFLLL